VEGFDKKEKITIFVYMKKPIIGAKKKAAAVAQAKFGNLPKGKGLSMQPSPASRREVESIKSKGLVAKSPMSKVEKSLTPSPKYSGYSETQINGIFSGYEMKAKEKRVPAIERDAKKQQLLKEYAKNKAAGAKKATKKK
jgi:hypothetical protein